MHKHENFDDGFLVHQIVTYDYNNPDHDNVTCEMSVSPDENNIFELVHDGSFKHNCKYICEWKITKITMSRYKNNTKKQQFSITVNYP